MIIEKEDRRFYINNNYLYMILTLLLSFFAFYVSVKFEYEIYNNLKVINFLTWHTIIEFSTVIFSFIIFNNCYHSFKHTRRIRLLILSVTFFLVGCIDFLHTISYEGMPYTFVESSATMATTYWIAGRLIMSLGIFITAVLPFYKKIKIANEKYVLITSAVLALLVFYIVTYKTEYLPPLYIPGKGLTRLKILLEYFIMMLQIASIFLYLKVYRNLQNKYLIVLCCGLIVSVFSEGLFTLYRSVYDGYNLIGHFYKAISFYLIYHAVFKYNIYMPYIQLKHAQDRIRLYANNLEKIVDKRTTEIKEVNERLIKEIDYAKNIQQSLLPPQLMKFDNLSFISKYIPCERLSGDFYEIYDIDENNIGMYILDVSGHGVPAALLTMFIKNYIKAPEKNIKRYRDLKPHKQLEYLYKEFNGLNFPEEMHMVIFFASYDVTNNVLTYCSGGMNCYPIVLRVNGEYEFLDKSNGFPICQFSNFYTPTYESAEIKLNKGDRVIFYTDGLVEKQKNTRFDRENLIAVLLENNDKDIEELNNKLLKELNISDGEIDDDITYFIMNIDQ